MSETEKKIEKKSEKKNEEKTDKKLREKIDYESMTAKQRKFFNIYVRNVENNGTKSLMQMSREAGYSEATAKRARENILETEAIFDNLQIVKKKMDQVRFKAIEALDDYDKLKETDARGLVQVISKLTETSRLIDDKSTENIQIVDDL